MYKCSRCGLFSDDGHIWRLEKHYLDNGVVKYVTCSLCLKRVVDLLNLLFLKRGDYNDHSN